MFQNFPVEYIDPVFRPPSEANSLIFQVTNGCSWNRCTYCDMYVDEQKKFRPKAEQAVIDEIRRCGETEVGARRVFLADGDALVLSMRRLRVILKEIALRLPSVTRVSSYCLPSNLKNKSDDELAELHELGLKLIYVGAETGNERLLETIDKGETRASTIEALIRAKQAGLKTSVMILNGLGGMDLSKQHAIDSADLVNQSQPDYLATLVLTFYRDAEKFTSKFDNGFKMPNLRGLCEEIRLFIDSTNLNKTIFRSDHVSNHLVLKGVLGRDKSTMLAKIDQAIEYFDQHSDLKQLVGR